MAFFSAAASQRGTWVVGGIAAALALGGTLLIHTIIKESRTRERLAWQSRLAVVADTRAGAANGWIEQQFAVLSGLSENASLQIYVTEITRHAGGDAALASYLTNLLAITASQSGFHPPSEESVPANVRRLGVAGLGIVDSAGKIRVATSGLPALEGDLARFVREAKGGERVLSDFARNAAGRSSVAFLAPIYAVQGGRSAADQVGWILGVREVGEDLYGLLRSPPLPEASAESYLIRAVGKDIEYLSPLADGTKPLSRRVPHDSPGLVDKAALDGTLGGGVYRDYGGSEVIAAARRLASAPWILVHKVSRAEALGPMEAAARRMYWILGLALVAVLGAVVAIWRHTASTRAQAEATRYEALARSHAEQGAFLKLLTDTAPDVLLVADAEGVCHFANRAAGVAAGVAPDDLVGKQLRAVLGPEPGRTMEERVRFALRDGERRADVDRQENPLKVTLAEVEPMDSSSRALVALRDITELVAKREHAERVVRETVSTLVSIIDRRDPHAAEHSRRVAVLAHDVAAALELDTVLVDTAEMAGLLSNVGKILLPSELLTRPDRLAPAELERVREAVRGGADLLKGIEFPGPVVETLRQMGERWDGTGQPRGLKGEEILLTARIVAAVNTFIALTRARADRPAMTSDEAVDVILKDSGKAFDRRVATALAFVAGRDVHAA